MKSRTSRSFCVRTGRSTQDSFDISIMLLIRIVLCQTCAAHLTHGSESESMLGSTRSGSCPLVKIATASLKAGGCGIRYTIRIGARDTYLFDEDGRWFVEMRAG